MTTAFPFRHHALTRCKLSVYALVGTVFLCTVESAHAVSPGALDPSFGNAGARIVAQSTISAGGEFRAIRTQADGKLVAGGTIANSAGNLLLGMIARFTPTGALDAGFGVGGVVNVPLPTGVTQFALNDVAIAPDGKIAFVGEVKRVEGFSAMLIGRLNANGALDTTFGGTGQVLRSVLANVNASGRAIGVQSDGRVVVAGTYAASDGGTGSATYRYTNAGISDSTFAGATVSISGAGYRIPNALVVRADDRIVVGGREWVPNTSGPYPYFSYLRGYAPDGAPDSALNAAFPAQQQDDQISALNVDASGRLLAAGVVNSDSGALAAARRFNPASPLVDQTFKNATVLGVVAGYRGVVLEGSNNTNAVGTGIHELANGDVLMSGFVRANSASVSWFTSRISTLGVVPTGGYASNAMEIKPNNQNGLALASTLAHDGNVVLAGFLTDTSNGKDYPAIAKVAVSGTSTNDAEVVEYYSPTLVKYFMTARLNEKQVLDQPNAAGLARTGVTFNAYATSAGVGKAVRRIFASQAGQFSTHFYLTEAADIAAVKAQPWANDEGVDMYFPTPTGDVSNRVCPTGTHNIWRTFKQKANAAATTTDPNHRYVRTSAALADMIRKGYVDEGVAFCGRL